MKSKIFTILSVSGLIVGNLIGAGILALPIGLGLAGAVPALISMAIFTILMLLTANILAREVTELQDPTFDYPSLYEKYLGKIGKWLAISMNAIILYGFLIAYISGGTQILIDALNLHVSPVFVALAFSICAIIITIMDLSIINKYNFVLVCGLITTFLGLVFFSAPHIHIANLKAQHWNYFWFTVPLILTAAHFHNIIPTLCKNIKYDLKSLKIAIFIGMFIAFIMNAGWTICGCGALPRLGDNSIAFAYIHNLPATVPLGNILNSTSFSITAIVFSLVAIVTSFITNGLGLMSFVNDLLYHTFKINNKNIVKLVTFLPPLIIAVVWPHIFIKALNIAGGIGIVMLFCILPSIIALKKDSFGLKYKILSTLCLILSSIAFVTVVLMQFNVVKFDIKKENQTSKIQKNNILCNREQKHNIMINKGIFLYEIS